MEGQFNTKDAIESSILVVEHNISEYKKFMRKEFIKQQITNKDAMVEQKNYYYYLSDNYDFFNNLLKSLTVDLGGFYKNLMDSIRQYVSRTNPNKDLKIDTYKGLSDYLSDSDVIKTINDLNIQFLIKNIKLTIENLSEALERISIPAFYREKYMRTADIPQTIKLFGLTKQEIDSSVSNFHIIPKIMPNFIENITNLVRSLAAYRNILKHNKYLEIQGVKHDLIRYIILSEISKLVLHMFIMQSEQLKGLIQEIYKLLGGINEVFQDKYNRFSDTINANYYTKYLQIPKFEIDLEISDDPESYINFSINCFDLFYPQVTIQIKDNQISIFGTSIPIDPQQQEKIENVIEKIRIYKKNNNQQTNRFRASFSEI